MQPPMSNMRISPSKGRATTRRRSSKAQRLEQHRPQPATAEENVVVVERAAAEKTVAARESMTREATAVVEEPHLVFADDASIQTNPGPTSPVDSQVRDTDNSTGKSTTGEDVEGDDSAQSVIVLADEGNTGFRIADVYKLMLETTAMSVVPEPLSPRSQIEEANDGKHYMADQVQAEILEPTSPVSQGSRLAQEISNLETISIETLDNAVDQEMSPRRVNQGGDDMQNVPEKVMDVVLEQQLDKAVMACSVAELVSSVATSPDREGASKGLEANLNEPTSKIPRTLPHLKHSQTQSNEVKADDLIKEVERVLIDTSIKDEANPDQVVSEEQSQPRQKRTRSGARFSDDTDMLKDFLNRAQARKAKMPALVQEIPHEVKIPKPPNTPPRRSPRKALAQLDNNSPKSLKLRDPAIRLGTPPSKPILEPEELDDCNEVDAESLPRRRSARKRLPVPAKLPPGAPSFIPVRRADGADPVVLQKSVAQELAILTRTNTRRNKGQAKSAKSMLEQLSGQVLQDTDFTKHKGRCTSKAVSWDDRLVYFQGAVDSLRLDRGDEEPLEIKISNPNGIVVKEQRERKEPRQRKEPRGLREVRATNGTPAPKRMTADMTAGATPKRPGKTRGT